MCVSCSPFSERASFYPFPSSLSWRNATLPLQVLLYCKKWLSWSCSFSRPQLSGDPHSSNYPLLLWHQCYFIYFIFLTFCSVSAFPLPIYIWVSLLPDRHLDPAPNMPSSPVCASCPCFALVAYSFHGYFLTQFIPCCFLLLGEYLWSTHVFLAAVAIKEVAIF